MHEYVLAHEADLFIYKDTSSEAVNNLTKFVKRLNKNKNNVSYVPDEITAHFQTINRSKLPENKARPSCKTISKPKPTIHDSLTRRLMLGPKVVVVDKKELINKNINRRILSAINFIYDDIDMYECPVEGVDLEDLKSKIERKRSCFIPNGKKILEELELIIKNNTYDDPNE